MERRFAVDRPTLDSSHRHGSAVYPSVVADGSVVVDGSVVADGSVTAGTIVSMRSMLTSSGHWLRRTVASGARRERRRKKDKASAR